VGSAVAPALAAADRWPAARAATSSTFRGGDSLVPGTVGLMFQEQAPSTPYSRAFNLGLDTALARRRLVDFCIAPPQGSCSTMVAFGLAPSGGVRVMLPQIMSIKFGTDGWRAIIAEEFTFANVERVAQATADYWTANPVAGTKKKVIVGYDRRFLSDAFGQRAAEVLAGNGFEVILTPCPTPTPSVSYAVKDLHAIGGVIFPPYTRSR